MIEGRRVGARRIEDSERERGRKAGKTKIGETVLDTRDK